MDTLLETIETPFNGTVTFHWECDALTVRTDVSGYSSIHIADFWKVGLQEIASKKVQSCLVLGVGGGCSFPIIREFFPDAAITGIDIDGPLVETAKKYVDLSGVRILIQDAHEYCMGTAEKYDLIIYDIFVRTHVPIQFMNTAFPARLLQMLQPGGTVIVNQPHEDFDGLCKFFPSEGKKVLALSNILYFYV